MRQTIYLLFLTMAAALTTGCTGSSTQGVFSQTDADESSFEQTQRVADSLYNCMQFRDAYNLYLQLLNNPVAEANSEKKLYVLCSLCNASELAGHKVDQNKWLKELIDLAKETGNNYYESIALSIIGQNVFFEGNRAKGIQYVNEAIDLMAKTKRLDADHLMHSNLNLLASLYSEMQDYDNALNTNKRNLQLTMEGTRWGDAQSQQFIDRRMALAKIAGLQAKIGNFQQADSAYAAWKAVQYEGNHTRDYFIVDYLKRRGLYEEAIPVYNKLIDRVRQQGDTLGEMMNSAKWGLAEVFHQMGHCEQAATLYEEVLEIQDTLKSRKARNTAQELAAVYHAQEQEQTIMQQEAENTRQRYLLFSVLAVLLGVTVLAFVIIRKNRIISRKNHYLAQQIRETLKYKETHPQPLPVREGSNYPQGEDSAEELSTPLHYREGQGGGSTDTLSEEQLFHYLNDVIVRERLFLNPNFDRQTIMDRFELSKERVGAAFSKGSQYAKLTDYTQELRLEYSTLLMSNNSDMSIAQIATDCGFSSYAYYCKCFRKRFGMTPTEFRSSSSATQEV